MLRPTEVVHAARDATARGSDALDATTTRGKLSALAVQVVVNIAMNVGLLPTTGITLPFLSYGGSSLIESSAVT